MGRFEIKDFKILSGWGFNLPTNTECTICRCNLNENSLYHQDKGIDSTVVIGNCGHSFHHECIDPWVKKNKHCPICSTVWCYGQGTCNCDKNKK
jgi:hypothetical protein